MFLLERSRQPASGDEQAPEPWRYPHRGIAIRLFLTCWIIYALHLATNTVREIYPALSIGDHFSFRVDEYANLHPDLFEKPGYGWHINSNPGASMLGAIPYAMARPVIDRVVERVNRARAQSGATEPPSYNSPWPMARDFFRDAWRKGLDVKFGLAAMVMQVFCMAPLSALGVVAMFYLLRSVLLSDKAALWLALLYGFGTPVFFRTGYLNHNLMMAHFALMGFAAMWNPGVRARPSGATRYFLGGLAGGAALLLDYSGVVLLLGLFLYGVLKLWGERAASHAIVRRAAWYVAGTLPPVGLLWFYQWASFGNPFLPAQSWMAPVAWIERGYQGFDWPQPDLLLAQLFDYRFGLFVTCPLLLVALAAPLLNRGARRPVPRLELNFALGISAALWTFCASVHYAKLQFNTGFRYLAPILPFLFLAAVVVITRLPKLAVYFLSVVAVAQAWCMAMYRDVERGLGVLEPVLRVFIGGFQLPALSVLSLMGDQYGGYAARGVSPLPLFALAGAVIFGIWRWPARASGFEEVSHRNPES
jgi:hypothetical protein